MATIHILAVDCALTNSGRRYRFEVPGPLAVGEIRRRFATAGWPEDVVVAHQGRVLEDDDELVRSGWVQISPRLEGIELGTIAIMLAISAAAMLANYFLTQALLDVPEADGTGSENPIYRWKGVQTTYGDGFRLPLVYGRQVVGGAAIAMDVLEDDQGVEKHERLRAVLALGSGVFREIAGLSASADVSAANAQTSFADPETQVRVNDSVLGQRVQILGIGGTIRNLGDRLGVGVGSVAGFPYTLNLPSNLPPGFPGSASPTLHFRNVQSVSARLLDDGDSADVWIYNTNATAPIFVDVEFAQGLFYVNGPPGSQKWDVEIDLEITYERGDGAASQTVTRTVTGHETNGFLRAIDVLFGIGIPPGLIDTPSPEGFRVRIVRKETRLPAAAAIGRDTIDTRNADAIFVDAMTVIRVRHTVGSGYRMPGVATCVVETQADDTTRQGRPNFRVPVRGQLVRWRDAAGTIQTDGYDPAGPFQFPVGENPAWVAVDLLTREDGLAFADDLLDWDAFYEWALFCDQDDGGDPLCACSIQFHAGDDPWDTVQKVFRAGRGVPVLLGSKIKPIYLYRDAHGSTPAKSRTAVVSSANVTDLRVRWVPTSERPNIYEGRYVDAENFEESLAIIEDDHFRDSVGTANLSRAIWRQEIDLIGIPNRRQVIRELWMRKELAKSSRKTIEFTCGPEQLAVEIGDVIGVEGSGVSRPFGDRLWFSCRTAAPGQAGQIRLDRDLSIPAGVTAGGIVHTAAGEVAITFVGQGDFPARTAIQVTGAAASIAANDLVVIGEVDGGQLLALEDYMVTAVDVQTDGKVRIRGVLWLPGAYDDPPVDVLP